MKYVVELAVVLILIGALMPIGIGYIENATFPAGTPSIVKTSFQVLIPLFTAIVLILAMMPTEVKDKIGL